MTSNPAYDYPEPYANPRQGAVALLRDISLVGRLRLTQPVWLQLGINSATALHILQREPAGTFLVRRSNTRQCQVLCLRLLDDSSPAFVTTYRLYQEEAAITLEGSDRSFPTLLRLIAFYCSVPDILPVVLRLPQPIWEASSCQELEAIAHLGLEFWNSTLNVKRSTRLVSLGSASGTDATSLSLPPRAPQGPNSSQVHGLPAASLDGLSLEDVSVRRQYFKSNVKVQVSTEAVSPLSPPAAPPPPIPVGKKKKKEKPTPPPQPPASHGKSQFSSWHFQNVSADEAANGEHCATRNQGQETFAPSASLGQLLCVVEDKPAEVPTSPRHLMHQFWEEHSRESSLQEMMLDSGAHELTLEDTPEILGLLPSLEGQDVLELGAGIGRFTGLLAESANHVTAVDFMDRFLNRNQQENRHRTNVTYLQADVINLEMPSQSFDLIFSNWLFMYLSNAELCALAQQMLRWLRPQGHIFFRESCFYQSGNSPRSFNPSLYRKPAEYNHLLTSAQVTIGNESYGFEIVLSRSVQTYIKRKQNQNQICWLLQRVPRQLKNMLGYDTFQKFLDNEQYSTRSIRRYEWIFGPAFVSTGGLDTTKELVCLLDMKPGQRVLDVGCGLGGSDFYMAKEFGVEVLGLDLSSNMVELALEWAQKEASSSVQFETSDVTRRMFPQASFDVVYSRDTILHIEDKVSLFQRFLLWLKPGGQLLISDYCCGPRPWSKAFTQYVKQRGYNLLTPEEYGQVLQEAGFAQVKALDSTERMLAALTQELQTLQRSREKFVQEFSEDEFKSMVSGWQEKVQRCTGGDQRWGVFLAQKPQ